jgi:hypothetical protein
VTADLDGTPISIFFEGATSTDAEWVSVSAEGIPGGGDFSAQVLRRGVRAWANLDGGWQPLTVPAGSTAAGSMSAAAFQELARYVKDVRVTEHQLVAGQLATVIAGEIDTEGLLESFLELGSFAGQTEGFALDFSKLGIEIGDVEAVLTIDERTQLLTSALITLSIAAEGRALDLAVHYRLTSFNEPVTLPRP